jgi:hypothetical protein
MSLYLVKTKTGYFIPFDDSDREAAKAIGAGEVVSAKASRNYMFLKKAMALMKVGHENQREDKPQYESFNIYRKVLTIRAGFYDEVLTKEGHTNYLPHSLSFDEMSAENFNKWYTQTLDIIAKDMETAPETIRSEVEGFY